LDVPIDHHGVSTDDTFVFFCDQAFFWKEVASWLLGTIKIYEFFI